MKDDHYTAGELTMTWRALVFGPLAAALFFLALWFNDQRLDARGPICLGMSFAVAMLWVVLAARASDNPNSPLRGFIPKMTAFLVLGTAFVAAARWSTDKRISVIEVGFAAFYIVAGYLAVRMFDAKRNRPQLKRP
ncbi:MAG: hypothetical protein ABSC63_06475 [Candidatus Binataceae bacterium]|jgi:hypothetical protein